MRSRVYLVLVLFALLLVMAAKVSAQDEPMVWVESSSTTQIKLGYSGFELGNDPGYLWVNEDGGTRHVDLYEREDEPGYIFGDIFSEFYCNSPKVIVLGYVYGSQGETIPVPEVEISCHTVRFPILVLE